MDAPRVTLPPPLYGPMTEGQDHINVFSRSRLELGRMLSNFALSPFEHPVYGRFASVEAFYYWLSTGMQHQQLKSLYGYEAKQIGSKFPKVPHPSFQDEIITALRLKIEQNERLAEMLRDSRLPIVHYYYYGSINNCKVQELPEHHSMTDAIGEVRAELQNREHTPLVAEEAMD